MAKKPTGKMTAGAMSGEGRLQKIKLQKSGYRMAMEGEKNSSRGDKKPRS